MRSQDLVSESFGSILQPAIERLKEFDRELQGVVSSRITDKQMS